MRLPKIMVLGVALLSCSDADVTSTPEIKRLDGTMALAATVPVARVKLYPYSSSLEAGRALQLVVKLYDSNGTELFGRTVAWSTNRAHVATVNAEGLVTGVGSGLATITASIDGQNGYAAINVSGTTTTVPVASVAVTPPSASIAVGQTRQLTATTLDANNNTLTGRAVAWSTSDASIATVSSSGLVTAIAAGTATVTATSEGRTGSSAITVNAPAPTITQVSVAPANSSLEQGQTVQLTATAQNSIGEAVPGQTYSWTSNNSAVATVNGSGLVMAVGAGTATITATTSGVSGTATITVTVPPPPPPTVSSVSVAPATSNVEQGQTIQLTATARNADGTVVPDQTFGWTSNNSAIATVNASGLVMAVGAGTATITATTSGVSGTASITVTVPPPPPPTVASVSVSPASATVTQGQTIQLSATARNSTGGVVSGQTFTWASNNTGVATVNANGLVTAAAAGAATITATTSGVSGVATITVTTPPPPPPPPPTGVLVLHQSDWRTQLGNTTIAISDGGKWNSLSAGASNNGSIIDAPAGFSTHKVLRVRSDGTRDGWLAPTVTTLGEIPIGQARNYRWEHAFHEPALSDAGQHPIQDGGAVSQSNWYMGTSNGGSNLQAGQWGLNYAIGGNPEWNDDMYTLGTSLNVYTPLQKGVVYRFEVQLVRISATQFRFHVWVHDANGNLLYDDDDFRNRNGTRHIGEVTHTFQVAANMSIFMIGLNGIANSPAWPIHSSDQAAIAVVQGLAERQQIGPYGSVQGEIRR